MAFITLPTVTLASALAPAGTLTLSYPANRTRGDFVLGYSHRMVGSSATYLAPRDFTLTLNASNITLTWNGGPAGTATLPAGTTYFIELDNFGSELTPFDYCRGFNDMLGRLMNVSGLPKGVFPSGKPSQVVLPMIPLFVSLGSPVAGTTTGIMNAQTATAPATAVTINGTLVSAGQVLADVPRSVQIVSASNLSTFTFTVLGYDVAGVAMTETITGPNATTVQGAKAFAAVTQVNVGGSGAVASFSIGFGNKLGLPVVIQSATQILKEIANGAAATAGTLVTAVATTRASATTGDPRGTYAPNSTPDGSIGFALMVLPGSLDTVVPTA